MAGDKSGKRRRFRPLPERTKRLLAFGVFAASFEIPPEERAERMERDLRWLVDLLHREGYSAPMWLLKPYHFFRRGLEMHDTGRERPGPTFMLGLVEGLVEDVPREERAEAMRGLLLFFRRIYMEGDHLPPEWVRLGLERYGRD